MAQSSDEIIKREILNSLGTKLNGLTLHIFPQSSNDDQKPFSEGGLTFGVNNVAYGSCDACWIKKGQQWKDPLTGKMTENTPVIAIEGTDALNRNSGGNALYQRFHHALGAVRSGVIGVYYLKKGRQKIQPDLFGMAYYACITEKTPYLIIDDLQELKSLIIVINNPKALEQFIKNKMDSMYTIFQNNFTQKYRTWNVFAEKRSTIIKDKYVIKYSGRNKLNFTDGSQRAGHIAVGEMYLTKYYFLNKPMFYLWPRIKRTDITFLDKHKKDDKEWKLLRSEKNVTIIGIDDLEGVPEEVVSAFASISDKPLKNKALNLFNENIKILKAGLIKGDITIKKNLL